jgi:predicted nucleic acid-binding protein
VRLVVADGSALVEYLLRTDLAASLERTIHSPDADLHVPALCDVEVTAGLRRGLLGGALSEERAAEAIDDYLDLPLARHGHQRLLSRVLGLKENFSAYDAIYVALAESLGAELLTADAALAEAARQHSHVVTVAL